MSTKITEHDLDPNMDMAHESTSQEILEAVGNVEQKMNEGVKVSGEVTIKETAQTKKFTQIAVGAVTTTEITITGCGYIWFDGSGNYSETVTFSIDGLPEVKGTLSSNHSFGVYFNESIVFKGSANCGKYYVQT